MNFIEANAYVCLGRTIARQEWIDSSQSEGFYSICLGDGDFLTDGNERINLDGENDDCSPSVQLTIEDVLSNDWVVL